LRAHLYIFNPVMSEGRVTAHFQITYSTTHVAAAITASSLTSESHTIYGAVDAVGKAPSVQFEHFGLAK
jgi:hypothetical protein